MSRSALSVPVSPLLVGLSEKKLRLHRKSMQIAQGFEARPPACRDCANFKPGQPVTVSCRDGRPRREWSTAYCGLGNFACDEFGICDLWRSASGETLEKT